MARRNPIVSILIPTLNSERVLKTCLESIDRQNYPKDKVEVIVADGGSVDNTVRLAKSFGAKVVSNPLKTGEAGKMRALSVAKGDFVALIDSDNILPHAGWLTLMVGPLLREREALGSEPLYYAWRKGDGFITRYCALIGMNDPLMYFLGTYDRYSLLSERWTDVPHRENRKKGYILATFSDAAPVPTIGANGTLWRKAFLNENAKGDYLFDIDILQSYIKRRGKASFVKTKTSIVHSYCENDIFKFARKQRRRARDFLFFKASGSRVDSWEPLKLQGPYLIGLIKFILSCTTVLPLFYQALRGYLKKPDIAWAFHPLACEITLWEYGWASILGLFRKNAESRSGWKQ